LRHLQTVFHRGFVLWRLSDDGPDASRINTRRPSSETLHKSTHYRSAALTAGSPQIPDIALSEDLLNIIYIV